MKSSTPMESRRCAYRSLGVDRQGSLFAIVLIVLFVATIIAGAMQLLSMDTVRQTRAIVGLDDTVQRAQGLFDLVLSRWKKQITYVSSAPIASPGDGFETGQWDSRPFALGWTRGVFHGDPPCALACVWVRFTDDRPPRTIRFDVALRIPTQIDNRIARILALEQDQTDPTSAADRSASFARVAPMYAPDPERQALVAATSRHAQVLAGTGATPEQVEGQLGTATFAGSTGPIARYLAARALISQATDPVDRVSRARAALDLARSIPAPDDAIWRGTAQCELAQALSRAAQAPPPASRYDALDEASRLLDDALASGEPACATTREAWRLAQVIMRRRHDLRDSAQCIQARDLARQRLAATCAAQPDAIMGSQSDVSAGELPALFDLVWAPRIAMGIQTGASQYVLASMLPDGTRPMIHLEASTPIVPLGWTADAGALDIAVGEEWEVRGQTVYRVSVDGSRITSLINNPIEVPPFDYPASGVRCTASPGDWRWYHVFGAQESPDGSGILIHGVASGGSGNCGFFSGTLVQHDPRIRGVPVQYWPGYNVSAAVFSPAADRLAVVSSKHGWDYVDTYVTLYDTPDTDGPGHLMATVRLPGAFLNDGWFAGLSWAAYPAHDWIAYATVVTGDHVQVVFVDPTLPPGTGVVVRSFVMPMQVSEFDDWMPDTPSTVGTLLSSPPGYLLIGRDRVHFEPLPGTTLPASDWPVDATGGLTNMLEMQASASGDLIALSGTIGDARAVAVRNTRIGQTRILAGPGGVFPAAIGAQRPILSPLPAGVP